MDCARNGASARICAEANQPPMGTLREKNMLEDLAASGKAPWKIWN
jgi:glucose-1-phosphate cytidylyltransferase